MLTIQRIKDTVTDPHVDENVKNRFTEVDWKLIKAARNYYAHVYRGVDWKMIWEVIVNDLPKFKSSIEKHNKYFGNRKQCKN